MRTIISMSFLIFGYKVYRLQKKVIHERASLIYHKFIHTSCLTVILPVYI